MNQYLILVKHSQPAILEHLPAREWRLSKIGISRAQRLADRLKSFTPEILISSIEPKASGVLAKFCNELILEYC